MDIDQAVKAAYKKLGLVEHDKFRTEQIRKNFTSPHFLYFMRPDLTTEEYLKNLQVNANRQTGRTTKMCIEAICNMMKGQNTLIMCGNITVQARIIRKVQSFCYNLYPLALVRRQTGTLEVAHKYITTTHGSYEDQDSTQDAMIARNFHWIVKDNIITDMEKTGR